MLQYRKGEQKEKLEELPTLKINLVMNGESEGIWVKQGPTYVVLQNAALAFYPFPSWGVVFPSENPPGSGGAGCHSYRETVDVSHLKPSDGLELHPEAWKTYLEKGVMDTDGNFIIPKKETGEER